MIHTRKRNIYLFIYSAIAVFYLWMAAQIPYTNDDWDWGLAVGMEQLIHATVNSRYAGNFLEVVMTRSEFLKVAIMGLSYFLIPFLLMRIAVKERRIVEPDRQLLLFLLCNCLILSMNHVMWREVYGWTAGFANFGVSALFLLLWLKELLRAFDDKLGEYQDSARKIILYFIASFCGQLFIENLAIYCVVLACALCVVYYIRFRRIPYRVLAMGIGAVSGLAVMFSSSIYQTLFSTGRAVDGYRVIPIIGFDSFMYALSAFKGQILHLTVRLYFNNIVLSLLVLATFLWVLYRKKEEIHPVFCVGLTIVNCGLLTAFVVWHFYDKYCDEQPMIALYSQFALAVIYFCMITAEVCFCFEKAKRKKLLALWVSAPVLIAPLLVTGEYGQRLFFSSNVIVIFFVSILLAELLEKTSFLSIKRMGYFTMCAIVLFFSFYGRIYRDIGACKRSHETIIQQAIQSEQEEIVLPAYLHDEYLHFPYPNGTIRNVFFKDFYGIPNDTELRFE